jgi:hypothetical protein
MELLDSDEDLDVYETAAPILFRPFTSQVPVSTTFGYPIIQHYP